MNRRGSEEQSGGGGANRIVQPGSKAAVKKTTPLSPGSLPTTTRIGAKNGGSTIVHQQNHLESMSIASKSAINDANNGVEVHEWPRIYVALSRKEKEEDYMAMKGSKLPHRPKKRPKAIDRMLQYCYPGMWLSELTRGRYEVREKKSTKKQKRRGLKGLESIESDSE